MVDRSKCIICSWFYVIEHVLVPLLLFTPLCCLESFSFPHLWFSYHLLFICSICHFFFLLLDTSCLPTLFLHPFNSSALSSCHNRVYQSLANLIRWADQVMLDGIDLEDKENVASVTSVIKAVLDGVKVGPLVTEEMLWVVFSPSSRRSSEAACVVFLRTGVGEADHRETGAAITHHP